MTQPPATAMPHDVAHDVAHYVGFWARSLAAIVDTVLFSLPAVFIGWYLFGSFNATDAYVPHGDTDTLLSLALPAVLVIAFWLRVQATPGKMLIAARIVDADTFGDPSPRQLILRYVGYYVSTVFLGLGFFWIAFDRRKQGWHDKIAGTVVIRAPREPAA